MMPALDSPGLVGFAPSPHVMLAVRDLTLRGELASGLRNDGFAVTDTSSSLHLVWLLCEAILENPDAGRPDCLILEIDAPRDCRADCRASAAGLAMLAELRTLGWNTPAILLADEPAGHRKGIADRPPRGAEQSVREGRSAMASDWMGWLDHWQPAWVLHRPIECATVRNMVWAFCIEFAHAPIATGPHRLRR